MGLGQKKDVSSDTVFRLLFINAALVIVGYALAVVTGQASVGLMRIIKYAGLFFSIGHLLIVHPRLLRVVVHYFQPLLLLSGTFIVFCFFGAKPITAILRVLTYVVPLLYVAFAVGYLLFCYPLLAVLHAFINALNWIYFIPVASYFLFGGDLSDTSIYQSTDPNNPGKETAFVSNHYGWASTIFLLTGLDLLRNVRLPRWREYLIIIFGLTAAYLVLISGNRTSWLSLMLVSLVYVFRYRRLAIYQKVLLSLIPLGFILYLAQDPDSAINARLEKTRVQQKKGESRLVRSRKMIDYFNKSPDLWLTGIGMFNTARVQAITGQVGYHNSYFEVLFGAGILVFAFFMYQIVIRPGWYYIRYFARYYLFFLPLLVIPFFESNLTGGQFLFFPWFIMAILMGYARTFAKIKTTIQRLASPD